jgi:ribosomal protein L24
MERKYDVGDAVVIEGTVDDGKVGTILKLVHDEYLVVLEDGTQVILNENNFSLRNPSFS